MGEAAATFTPKRTLMDWDLISRINIDRLLKNESKLDEELESLYPLLISAKISDNESRATPDALVKLFRLCQYVMELKNMFLEGAESQIERIEETLKTQEIEISKLKGRSGATPSAELRMLRQENLDLERRNELLTRDLQRIEENYAKEVKYGQEVGAALSEEKARYATLSEAMRELQNEMKEREVQMVSQRHRLLSKNIEEEEFRGQLKEKNLEINKYLSEIKSLTTQNNQLASEVETIGQELDATVLEIERNSREIEEMQTIITNNDLLLDQVTEERDTLKIKVEELNDKLQLKQSQTDEAVETMNQDIEYMKKLVAEAETSGLTYKHQIERLNQDVNNLRRNATAVDDDALRTEIREKDEVIESLRLKLDESYKDFEVLSLDWDRIDSLVKDKAGGEIEGLRSQAALAHRLREKIKLFKDRHSGDMEKMKQLQKQLEEKERELVLTRDRMDSYEKGVFGLRESIREAKQLKLEKSIRDKEIASLAQKINDFEQQVSDLVEENEELRNRLGLKSATKIDLSNVQSIKTVELEKAKGLAIALQKEVDALEEERLKLKESLRTQALSRGERAVAMGLGVEELTAVEEYAAKLRGNDDSPVDIRFAKTQRPVLNNSQLEKLTIELERVHVEASEARERYDNAEKDLRRIQAENRALEAVVKEVSVTLIKTRSGSPTKVEESKNSQSGQPNQIRFPVIEKLLKALEKKRNKDLSNDLYGNEIVEDQIVQVNQNLREELLQMRIRMEDLERLAEDSKKLAESSQKNAEALRMRAMKARGKVLELPSELLLGSVHDYSAVVEQLVECLMELQVKDKELRECRVALENFELNYASLVGKQRHLYRDYNIYKRNSAVEIENLKDTVLDAHVERDGVIIRVEELERLLKALHDKCEWNHTQRCLVESQRNVAVLRVNEITMKRKYMAVADAEVITRKENMKLKTDLMALDRVARETIGRLTRAKFELRDRVQVLTEICQGSVPKTDYNLLQNKLDLYVAKTKLLLDREQNWISERDKRESDSKELVLAKKTILGLEINFFESQKIVTALEKSLKDLSGLRNDIQSKEQLSVAHERIVKLEVAQDVMQKRVELAESKCAAMESHETQLKERLDSLEESYLEASENNVKLKEVEIDLKNLLEGSVSQLDHEKTVQQLKVEKEVAVKLNSEVAKYKDLADISSNQTADLLHLCSQDEKEKAILRATIQELQMEGDEKLLIGKLHHHILALQMSESGVIRKLEAQQTKCLRLESRVVKLERAVDERDALIFQIKMDSRNSLRLLQKAVSEMRTRLAGHVTLEKHERVCATAQSLDYRKMECEDKVNYVESQKRSLEDQIAERELELNQLRELIEALQNPSTTSERIVSWQSRMATLQVSNLRISRDLDFQRQTRLSAEANLQEHMGRVTALEDQLVAAQLDMDNRQLEWEKRQEDMESIIQQLESEREQIFHAASLADLKHALPDRSLPISHQLEAALRMLVERSRLLTAQEIKISNLERKIEKFKEKIKIGDDKVAEKEAHITELRIDVARNDLREGEGFTEYDTRTRALVRKREGEAMKNAQEVINSLQRQLIKKDELVERYRNMITEHKKEAAARKEAEKTEISNLTEMINTLNDRQVQKLHNPHEVPQSLLSNNKDLEKERETVNEFEALLKGKEEELTNVREKYAKVKEKLLSLREETDTEISNLREELSVRNASHHEYEFQIEALKRDLHLNEKELALATEAANESIKSRGLQEHVAKLDREIVKRDTKISNMSKAIHQLKEALIKTAEEAAESKIRNSNEYIASGAEPRGLNSMKKLVQLETKVDRLNKTIEAHQKKEKELHDSLTKLKSESLKRDKENDKLEDKLEEAQKALKKLHKPHADEEASHSRSGSSKWHGDDHHGKHGSADDRHHDKEARLAKLLEEEKKRAAETAKERWESEKKQQKKFSTLKSKLNEKTQELAAALDREKHLKESISRLSQDNHKANKKISNLNALPHVAAAALEAQHQQHLRDQQQRYSDTSSGQQSGSFRESDSSRTTTDRTSTSTDTSGGDPAVLYPPDDPDITPEEAAVRRRLLRTLHESSNTQRRVLELEKEVIDWKEKCNVSQAGKIKKLRMEKARLEETIAKFEGGDSSRRTSRTTEADDEDESSDSSSSYKSDDRPKRKGKGSPKHTSTAEAGGFEKDAKRGEKSKHVVPMLESRIQDLLLRLQNQEDEKFAMEQKLVEVKFEMEKAVADAESMQRHASELEDALLAHHELAEARRVKRQSNEIPGLNVTYTQLRTATSRLLANKSKDELAAVIDHLSTAAEKLKLENETLKKGSGGAISNLKYMEMTKEIKNLRKEKHEAVEAAKAKAISDAQTIKVEQENTKLRNLAQKDAEKIKKLIERVKSLELTNENLGKEVKQLQRQYKGETSNHHDENDEGGDDNDSETHEKRLHRVKYAEQVAHLKGKLAEKDEIINTLAADGNGSSSSEMRKLRRELEMWKAQCTQVKEQLSQYTASDNVNSGYRPSTRMEANIVELRGGMGEVVVERNALRDRVAELERDVDQLRGELSNFDGSRCASTEKPSSSTSSMKSISNIYVRHVAIRLTGSCRIHSEGVPDQEGRLNLENESMIIVVQNALINKFLDSLFSERKKMGRKKMPKTTPNRRKTPSSQSSADAASTSSAVTPMAPLPSHAQSGVGKSAKPKSIADELPDFILLIVLYLLQGVPLGLIMGSVPFLLKAKLSFGDIALFSLSSYPYSLKLLWSPIVDSVYSKPIGRRKSWIVPIQAITGFFMLFLSTSIDDYVSPASTSPVPVTFLALTFAALVFLCATQDIAVDGWALTLLSEENKAYASTAQTIGLNSGYFLSFTVFLALNSTEFCEKYLGIKDGPLILLGQYLGFWGVMFLVCDLWLIIMKNEGPEAEEPAENEIQIVYKHIFQVISLPNMRQLIFMTMISKIGFMAHDSVSALKLLEKGFSKEDLALTVLIDFPIQIFVGYYVAKWSAGPRPLRPWLTAFHIRLAFSALGMLIVHSVPTPLGTGFFLFVIATSVLNSMVSTVMFVGVGSYYTQISDPRIGGTYMTLLNTVNNLAGTWPKYFVLRAVDYWTEAACVGVSEPFPCKSDVTRGQCVKAGGVCEVARDGYYPVGLACLAVGVVVLFAVVRPTVAALEKVPESAWRVSRDGEEGGEEMAQLISKRD